MLESLRNIDFRFLQIATDFANSSPLMVKISSFLAGGLILLFPLVLYILWLRPEHRGRVHGAQKTVMMSIVAVVLTFAIKSIFSLFWWRQRPFLTHPEIFHMNLQVDPISFPSGHTMLAFSIAVSLILGGYKRLGNTLLFLACLVGLGRVLVGVHYPSDVIAGAIVGSLVAWYIHREASSIRRYLPNH